MNAMMDIAQLTSQAVETYVKVIVTAVCYILLYCNYYSCSLRPSRVVGLVRYPSAQAPKRQYNDVIVMC